MNKKTKRKLKRIAALGLLGMGAKMGMSKMAENRAIKEMMKAKPMYATKMNEQRIPAFIKKRGIKGGNPLRPRGDITGQTFGIDPFGPGGWQKKVR